MLRRLRQRLVLLHLLGSLLMQHLLLSHCFLALQMLLLHHSLMLLLGRMHKTLLRLLHFTTCAKTISSATRGLEVRAWLLLLLLMHYCLPRHQ